jgi:hypothetical protein
MSSILHLRFGAPIPVGHTVEITSFEDPRPEGKRKSGGAERGLPHTSPAILDLDTGIRHMTHVHASSAGNGGNPFSANPYPLVPRPELAVAAVSRATVTACTLVYVEGLATTHTVLEVVAA